MVVAVCRERSLELIVALLGILKAGGAYASLDPSHPRGKTVVIITHDERYFRWPTAS
jgi:non-ribosomal peptide synthetase component F